jgi:hypothetical protein
MFFTLSFILVGELHYENNQYLFKCRITLDLARIRPLSLLSTVTHKSTGLLARSFNPLAVMMLLGPHRCKASQLMLAYLL